MSQKKLTVKCPSCEKKFNYYASEFRPFCSERCRMIDLGQWLDESYRVPSKSPVDVDELIAGMEQHEFKEDEKENDDKDEPEQN